RAALGAAKSASANVDAAEAEANPQEAKAAPESPDGVPQGETRAAAQAATPASAHVTHAVRGSPETVANLAAQILKKLDGKSTRFDVELDPHGLGKVDVRIEIGAQGRITAGMTFDNPQAAADVKARAAELHRALEQAGFDLSGGLTFDVASDRGQQQQQQNQAWQDQGDAGRAFQGRAFRAALETAGDAADAANQGALRLRRGVNSGLDLRI
ncbi:MAG TPA: flagellar hook-length control protein FliK, partial [Phenylobacterium sp.]